MSAIYGVLSRTAASLDGAVLLAMREELRAWAGRGGSECTRGCVALGVVEDREAGAPPLPSGRPVLVADARLDNRDDLARGLRVAASVPDEELILAAYERWGARCPAHLVGAFAFAIWDEPRSTLLCARDHIGLRPLYFWRSGDEFLFASDPAALLATGRPSGEVDETAFVAKLVDHHGILRERSFHAGIAKLPPGETLEVTPGGAGRRAVHWAPGSRETLRLRRREDYAGALREALAVAVSACARPGDRIAAHFSGGLDSSAVAVMAHRELARRGGGLEALFSWSPAPAGSLADDDERRRLLPLAASLGLEVSWASITPADIDADDARQAALVANETLLYEHAILREAQTRGIGVLLSGWGGDETASFHGHGHARWLARTGRWRTLFHEIRVSSRGRGHRGVRLARNVAVRMIRAPFKPGDDGAVWTDLGAIHPLAAELQRDVARRSRTRLAPRDTQVARVASGHLTSRVETWVAAGARHGVDYRFPMLDRRLIDLCLSFPSEVWVHDGVARWPFRTAMTGILPHELCWGRAKAEPGRIEAHLGLFMRAGPRPEGAVDERARMVALVRERQREALRRQRG